MTCCSRLERALRRARHRSLRNMPVSMCFRVAEQLRTEAHSRSDLRMARRLYHSIVRAGQYALRCKARERLILMLCQEGAGRKEQPCALDTSTAQHLRAGGFVCRLAPAILHYDCSPLPLPSLGPPPGTALALDGALPTGMLRALTTAFAPTSPFWAAHRYRCGKTPFFSYVHEIGSRPRTGFDRVLATLHAHACKSFPSAKVAKYAEWWAHCRPHGVGHQYAPRPLRADGMVHTCMQSDTHLPKIVECAA